jgi:hypothetical protein
MKRMMLTLAGLIAFGLTAGPVSASIILNGSFENNSAASTQFNMSNAAFSATVADATAFGAAQEIDLVTGLDFGIAPIDGDWKLGLHTQVSLIQDAFSMSLSSGIVAGTSYDLSFSGALLGFGSIAGNIEIGVSNSASAFGTLVFAGTPASDLFWSSFASTFVAPVSGSFLTVRTEAQPNVYVFVDDFSLDASGDPVPEPATLFLLGSGLLGLAARRRRDS